MMTMNIKKVILFLTMIVGCVGVISAQSYYDDDIYYDASKAKKEKTTKSQVQKTPVSSQVYDFPAADTYEVEGVSYRDIDEYNRRGNYAKNDTTASDSLMMQDFEYTQRIERFYNPDVVKGSTDEELKTTYYSSVESPEINVYYIDNDPWLWNSWYYPYSWRYHYSPYYWSYSSWWGPSWYYGPSWCYDPYWGPSWYPGYYPPHHHHGPGYAPAPTHRPATSGAYRPARPGRNGSYANGSRPGSRPGSSSRGGVYSNSGRRTTQKDVYNGSRPATRDNGHNSSVRSNRTERRSSEATYDRQSNTRSERSYSTPSRSNRSSGMSSGSRGGSRGGGRNGRH